MRSTSSAIVRNRRLAYLTKHPSYLNIGVEYKDPLLYDTMIRRFQSAAEREDAGRENRTESRFSLANHFLQGIDRVEMTQRKAKAFDARTKGIDSSDVDRQAQMWQAYEDGVDNWVTHSTNEMDAKERNKVMFEKVIRERFLAGLDEDFDYRTVDNNEAYDDMDVVRRDEEDSYFDQESPSGFDQKAEIHMTLAFKIFEIISCFTLRKFCRIAAWPRDTMDTISSYLDCV